MPLPAGAYPGRRVDRHVGRALALARSLQAGRGTGSGVADEARPAAPRNGAAPRVAGARRPSPRELSILAAAFELTRSQVLDDAAYVAAWPGAEPALLAVMARRHAWDRSVPPYYLAALRRVLQADEWRL
jgi:hypothetical protein